MRFLFILLFFTQIIFSQKVITGKVLSKESATALPSVFVRDTKTENWTISDKDGNFTITLPYFQDIELNFSILGKKDINQVLKNDQNSITVYLEDNTLFLKEVVVTAEKKRQYSELTLGTNAINNVQAFSLDDVLQQLPGQTTTDFNLNQFKNIVFRTATANISAKAFGTSFVMNDIPLSNNENMQAFNPNSGLGNEFGTKTNIFTHTNAGIDLREISTNNIEEIKVIQGIPSAKYGDLTSGLVLITTKVGNSPYRVLASIKDATSELNLTKGFNLNTTNSMNFGINYLNSKADARDNLLDYERINGNISWQYKNNDATLKNTISTSFRMNIDDAKKNPDDLSDQVVRNEKKGISISNNLMWKPKNLWIEGINVNAGFSYDKQLSRKERWVNTISSAATNSYEEGIHEAVIVPNQYTSISSVEGIPMATFLTLETTKTLTNKNNWVHSLVFGISNRMSSNKGAGRKNEVTGLLNFYTLTREGSSTSAYRDYNFKNTKTEYQTSAYLENRIYKKFENNQILNVDLGARLENQMGSTSLQPRINSSFSLNKTFRIRGGVGLSSKAPSLNQMYTGERYQDKLVGTGIYTYPGIYQKAWIQTIITPGDNLDLKPSKSYRTEAGFDISVPFASINVTGYYNKLFNGFSTMEIPVYRVIPKAEIKVTGTEIPTYTIVGTENYYYFNQVIANNNTSEDKGVEATINFKKIEALNLDVSLNAAYVHTKDFNNVKNYFKSSNILAPEIYGVYNPEHSFRDNFNINSNFNYHIPAVGLLISVRTEHLIYQNRKLAYNNYPNGYLDSHFNYHEIPLEDRTNIQKYGHLIKELDDSQNKLENIIHNFHLRVSKDFQNGFGLSFYATNFLNLKPSYISDINDTRLLSSTADFSFGAKLSYEL